MGFTVLIPKNLNAQKRTCRVFRLTKMKLVLTICISLFCSLSYGQKIDITASYREMPSDKYFRIIYENDLFNGQDKNYTQGYSFEYVSKFLLKSPLNKLFFSLNNDVKIAGIAFEHVGFTPDRYEKIEIQRDDRPFASVLMLKSFSVSMSESSRQRIASHISFGVMGPAAQGKEIQTTIHSITGDRVPRGWVNQIENHFILNYGIDYEKEVIRINNNFGLYANVSAKFGNLYTNATLGFNTTFGLINNPYQKSKFKKTILYGYIQPLVTVVGYDGTLQGGILGDQSVYTIAAKDVTRVVTQVNYGIVLQTIHFYLEYSGVIISKEINTLDSADWGGIRIGLSI